MSEINIESIRTQLGEFVKAYQPSLRGKLALLYPLKAEILELNNKGAKSADISAILAQYQITVSKDTIARFLREETKKERTHRTKKSDTESQPLGNDNPPPTQTVPHMLPRVAPIKPHDNYQ